MGFSGGTGKAQELSGGGGWRCPVTMFYRFCWSGASGPEARPWRELWHSDAAPGPCGGSSPGTFLRKSLPRMVGLIRVGCSPLVVGRFRPSQWRERVCTAPWRVASAPVALCRLRPVDGRLNSASGLVDPFLFPLRWAHCGPRCGGVHAPRGRGLDMPGDN